MASQATDYWPARDHPHPPFALTISPSASPSTTNATRHLEHVSSPASSSASPTDTSRSPHCYTPIDIPLIAELPADSVFPSRPRSGSPSNSDSGGGGGPAGGAAASTSRYSTYSQAHLQATDGDGDDARSNNLGDDGAQLDRFPTHPIQSMQGPFEESISESVDPNPFDDRDTMDAVSRRQQLLELESLSAEYSSRWRRRPGAKYHPLWKLIAQISFGIHLLHTQTAKSDEEVVKILQTHVDEVDGFLEDTSNDFALALKDIYERNRFLSVPLEHGRTFDKMLRDREFRTAIIEGNETIEHIVERTSQAMHFALQDIIQGIDATAELAKFLDRLVPQCADDSDMIKIYAAMRGNAEGWWRCFCDLQVQSEKLTKLLGRLESILVEVNRRTGMASRRKLSKSSSSSGEHHHIAKQQRSNESARNSISPVNSNQSEQLSSRRYSTSHKKERRHRSHNNQTVSPVSTINTYGSPSQHSLANKASQISFLEKPLPPDPLHAARAAERIRHLDPSASKPIPRASRTRSQPPTPGGRHGSDPSLRHSRSVEHLAPPATSAESFATVPEETFDPDQLPLTAENLAPINQQFHSHVKNPSDVKSRAPTIPDKSNRRPGLNVRSHTYDRSLDTYKYENPDAIKSSPSLSKIGQKTFAAPSAYAETVGLGITRPKSADGSPSELLTFKYEGPDDIKSQPDQSPVNDSSLSLEQTAHTSEKLEKLQTSIRASSGIARLPSIPTLPSLESDDGSHSNTADSAIDSAYASGGDSGLDDPIFGVKLPKRSKLASYYDVPDSIINLVADGRHSMDLTALPKFPADALDVDMGFDLKTAPKHTRRPSIMRLFASKKSPKVKHFAAGGLGGNVAMV